MKGRGVLMSRTQALEAARAITNAPAGEAGSQALVRVTRYDAALHVELIRPPFGASAPIELLRIEDPDYVTAAVEGD